MSKQPDKLPPHSPEAERGVIGCVLLEADCLDDVQAKLKAGAKAFYELRHQHIYGAMIQLKGEGKGVDLITLHDRLRDKQLLEQIGGVAYLSEIEDSVPSAHNLPNYL